MKRSFHTTLRGNGICNARIVSDTWLASTITNTVENVDVIQYIIIEY